MNRTVIDMGEKVLRWEHPNASLPESVLIVGLGPTKADLLNSTTLHVPDDALMGVDEVWGVNAAINHFAGRIRYDMIWMMDHLDGEVRKYPKYIQQMERYLKRHQVPLITSDAGEYAEMDHVYEYPLHWIYLLLGDDGMYMHNSIPYMLAYALAIGVKEIHIWGCDYSYEKEKTREDDRANAEYWIGFARARGVKVLIPASSSLTSADKGLWFYGYRDQPMGKVLKQLNKSGMHAAPVTTKTDRGNEHEQRQYVRK